MIVRGTSIIDVGGVAGCGKACEEKGGEELKHGWTLAFFPYSNQPTTLMGFPVV